LTVEFPASPESFVTILAIMEFTKTVHSVLFECTGVSQVSSGKTAK